MLYRWYICMILFYNLYFSSFNKIKEINDDNKEKTVICHAPC